VFDEDEDDYNEEAYNSQNGLNNQDENRDNIEKSQVDKLIVLKKFMLMVVGIVKYRLRYHIIY